MAQKSREKVEEDEEMEFAGPTLIKELEVMHYY